MRKPVILLITTFLSLFVDAQTPLYQNFTTKDGLSSNETHWITQDDSGYMWIATDKGVCKYDGYKFTTYTSSDGISDNVVFKIFSDPYRNRLLFGTYTGGLFVYEKGKFFEHPLNQKILFETKNNPIVSLDFKKDGGIVMTTSYYNVLIEIPNDSTIFFIKPEKNKAIHRDYSLFFFKHNNSFIYEYQNTLDGKKNLPSLIDKSIFNKVKKPFITTNGGMKFLNCHPFYLLEQIIQLKNGHYIMALSNYGGHLHYNEPNFVIFEVDERDSIILQKPTNNIVSLITEINNDIYIGITSLGLLKFKNGDLNSIPDTLFAGSTPTRLIKDDYSNYWMTSTNNGIYRISSFKNKKLNKIQTSINSIKSNGNQLLITTVNNQLYMIDSLWNVSLIKTFKNKIKIFDYVDKKVILSHGSQLLISLDNGNNFTPILYEYGKPLIGTTDANFVDRSRILTIGGGTSAIYTNLNKVTEYSIASKNRNAQYKKALLLKDTMWITALQGLFYEKDGEGVKYNHELLNTRLTDITTDGKGRLFLGTKNYGVSIKSGGNIIRITKNNGLGSDIVDKVKWLNNALWVITSSGVSKVSFHDNKHYTVTNFQELTERSCGKIYDINMFMGKMVVATQNGIFIFNDEFVTSNISRPKVTFTSILINDKTENSNTYIESNTNKIAFNYWAYIYGDERPIKYKYILKGYSKDTIKTDIAEVQFTNLPSGDYTFNLWASSNSNNWTLSPITYSFTVHPYFTETWWFISILILGGILIVSGIFLLIIRNLNRRSALQKNLLLSEQKALRAQMNPHFTFNALNSIQYFLTDNDRRSATTFLSKFSMLVRKVLYNSNNNLITLEEEINTLKLYLDLEALRFGDKLTVNINVDEDIYADEILVPSMIIQPFLENAIWHGIMPKESGKGNLELNFSLSKNQLVCKIKDDGIGREKSAELKAKQRKGHKSTGLKNIEERIKVLNHINESNISLEIIDLERHSGTEVIIYFDLPKE